MDYLELKASVSLPVSNSKIHTTSLTNVIVTMKKQIEKQT